MESENFIWIPLVDMIDLPEAYETTTRRQIIFLPQISR